MYFARLCFNLFIVVIEMKETPKLSKKQIDKLQKILLAEREEIVRHLYEIQDTSAEELVIEPGDDADIASTEITQAALQKLGTRENKYLSRIDHALNKIEGGDYGICEECGEPIAYARLEARPIAHFCIDCKTLQERKEKQFVDLEEDYSNSWMTGEKEEAE